MDVRVGTVLPPFVRTTDLDNWNRYAAVNDEFVTIHQDDEKSRLSGLPGAIGMGNLQIAYLHNLLREWVGQSGRILRLRCQHRGYNLKGDTLTARGRVTAVRDSSAGQEVDVEIWVENQAGTVLTPGAATVLLDTLNA